MQLLLTSKDQLPIHLKAMRQQAKLSQKELASKLQLSQSRLARMEAHPERIRVEQLLQLLDVLGAKIMFEVHQRSQDADQANRPTPYVPKDEW